MRCLLYCLLLLTLLAGCEKEHGQRVDIYLLRSFTVQTNSSHNPPLLSITGAVLEESPLVADGDIAYYNQATATFHLRKDIPSVIRSYGGDKAFAVTVDGKPVYYGRFHPSYLSSITFGLATIDPIFISGRELPVRFQSLQGSPALELLDLRNDKRLMDALKASGRLR
jgi:hypothetical protein